MLQPLSFLSQGSGTTGYSKFLPSMITVWVPMFLISWFGELLTEQVLFVIFCVTIYYSYDMIYLLTAVGLSPGSSTHLHTNNT
jgi:hypothetical protein